jgi:hypothetical protein
MHLQKVITKKMRKNLFFVEVTDEKSRIWIRMLKSSIRMIQGSESGSVTKCHGSGTLHQTKTAFFYYILTKKIQKQSRATRIGNEVPVGQQNPGSISPRAERSPGHSWV